MFQIVRLQYRNTALPLASAYLTLLSSRFLGSELKQLEQVKEFSPSR